MTTPLEHRERGQALRAQGRHAEAVEAFSAAAEAALVLGDRALAARVRVGSIDSLGMLGRYDEAVTLATELERTLREEGLAEAAAKVVFNVGGLHYRRDQYAAALACFERAGEQFATSPQADFLLPHVWTNTALALTFLDRTDDALALYQRALGAFRETEQESEAAVVEANIGFVHQVSGRYGEALAALNPAREALEAQGQLHEAARYTLDAGDAYRALNLFPEARACYEQALALLEQHPLPYEQARAHLGRSVTLTDDTEAKQALEQAEDGFRRLRVAPQRAHAQLVRAQRFHDAALAEKAARTFARCGLTGWAAEATLVAVELGGVPNRRRLLRVRRVARQTSRGWLECRANRALGLASAAEGKGEAALGYLRASVTVLESVRGLVTQEEHHTAFLSDKLAVYEALVGLLLERGEPHDIAEALEQVERSRSRLLLERVLAAGSGEALALPEALQATLATLRAQLSRAYHQEVALGESEARRLSLSATVGLETLERAYQALLQQVEPLPATHLLAPPVRTSALCLSLCPDQCLVEYYLHQGTLGAFVLSRHGVQFVPALCEAAVLEQVLRRLRFYLQTAATDAETLGASLPVEGVQGVLKRLYDLLLRPLEPWLAERSLVIVPHGPLHRVPFHALHDGVQSVVDRGEVTIAPSASLWHALQQAHRPAPLTPALLLGVPEPGIAQVAQELEALQGVLPGATVLSGDQATLEAFWTHAPGKALLHLATHGLFRADNPLFSGLRFADGWLLARDLYRLRLDAELITLSACRTGVSEVAPGEELFGLVRGFLAAGARALAVSLWPADDRATARLMPLFYQRLQAGASPSAALRAAQQELRNDFPHPYHWAPFCLMGAH